MKTLVPSSVVEAGIGREQRTADGIADCERFHLLYLRIGNPCFQTDPAEINIGQMMEAEIVQMRDTDQFLHPALRVRIGRRSNQHIVAALTRGKVEAT